MAEQTENMILEDASSCVIHYGIIGGIYSATITVNLSAVTNVDKIQDEIVYGDIYPAYDGQFPYGADADSSSSTYGTPNNPIRAYKFNNSVEPFFCLIKILLPFQTYRIEFFDGADGEGNSLGDLTFYTYDDEGSVEYYPCYYTTPLFRYCKKFDYQEGDVEVTLHKLNKTAHTKDTEVLSEVYDQSILSTQFVGMFTNEFKNSQLVNGNLLTKDCHLLYIGNLIRDDVKNLENYTGGALLPSNLTTQSVTLQLNTGNSSYSEQDLGTVFDLTNL